MFTARASLTMEMAEAVAVQGLAFLAAEPVHLARFLTLTGLAPDQVRAHAQSPEFLAAVLEHLANDESLLLVFAANASIDPQTIAPAVALLQRAGDGAAAQ